jgi:hypothetical protein
MRRVAKFLRCLAASNLACNKRVLNNAPGRSRGLSNRPGYIQPWALSPRNPDPELTGSPDEPWRELRRFAARLSGLAFDLALTVRPAGPAGLGRSRADPEDRFCGVVRNDLRVPLTLEGAPRAMRGIPAPMAETFRPPIGALAASGTLRA